MPTALTCSENGHVALVVHHVGARWGFANDTGQAGSLRGGPGNNPMQEGAS